MTVEGSLLTFDKIIVNSLQLWIRELDKNNDRLDCYCVLDCKMLIEVTKLRKHKADRLI